MRKILGYILVSIFSIAGGFAFGIPYTLLVKYFGGISNVGIYQMFGMLSVMLGMGIVMLLVTGAYPWKKRKYPILSASEQWQIVIDMQKFIQQEWSYMAGLCHIVHVLYNKYHLDEQHPCSVNREEECFLEHMQERAPRFLGIGPRKTDGFWWKCYEKNHNLHYKPRLKFLQKWEKELLHKMAK